MTVSREGEADSNLLWLMRYSAGGELLWAQSIAMPESIAQSQVGVSEGIVYVTSSLWEVGTLFYRSLILQVSPEGEILSQRATAVLQLALSTLGESQFVGGIDASHPDYDAWFAELGPAGDFLWQRSLSTPDLEQITAIAAAADGLLIIGLADHLSGPGGMVSLLGRLTRHGEFDGECDLLRSTGFETSAVAVDVAELAAELEDVSFTVSNAIFTSESINVPFERLCPE